MIGPLSHFFDLNYPLVQFLHGLVYFVLGLAIAMQARYRSRLVLAHSLSWLAMFGVLLAIYEWGQLFIPLQAEYMNHAAIGLLQIFGVLVLGAGFMALLQFGVSMLMRWRRAVRWLTAGLFLGWLTLILLLGGQQQIGVGLWELYGTLAARYLLGIPAALLTAYGLRVQAERQVRALGLASVYNRLRMTGVAFLFVALFGGLVGPYARFWPASVINQSLLVSLTGVPVEIFRSLAAVVILWGILGVLPLFEFEVDRELEALAVAQNVLAERERIGRELHDGAIQQVYTAGLLVESLRPKVADLPPVAERVERAVQTINEAITGLRAYMTDLREPMTTVSLLEGLRLLAYDSRFTALLQVKLIVEGPTDVELTPLQTTHVLAIASEALSNCVRHAHAQHVTICWQALVNRWQMTITDDGVGFDPTVSTEGFGLRNMRDRARLLNGELAFARAEGGGTTLCLGVPRRKHEITSASDVGGRS